MIRVRFVLAWLSEVRETCNDVFREKPKRTLILVSWFPAALLQGGKQYKQIAAPVGMENLEELSGAA